MLGVDLAENLLELARAKAQRRGFTQVEFQRGDMMAVEPPDARFDAVVCVFGIFFVPDMPAAVRELWSRVKFGGKLAITTWGQNFFEPANTAFWDSIRQEAPEFHKSFNPWDRISQPESLAEMLSMAGVKADDIEVQNGVHPINGPEDWWATLLGTGYRGTIDQLDDQRRERVRKTNFKFIDESGITGIEANVIYAVALKE